MTGTFDDTAKEEVRLRADIAAVVGRYVKLRQSGSTLKGLCPFHKEKTPSFHVNPSRGFFHCFGCGKGGDVFRFLQEIEGVSFPEALTMLAEETGVTLAVHRAPHEASPDAPDAPALPKSVMLEIHKAAADFFYGQIRHGPEAVAYLKSRGLAPETVRDFRLGYAPQGWTSLISFAGKKGISVDALVACGLAIRKEDGGTYDRFRDRIMFSLFDLSGRVVAFAGRGRDKDATPKYLNSPETPIYRKKEFLYGLNLTRQYIKDEKQVLVVEGYMDFLTLYQSGIRNVVATSGTAMTAEHAHLLKRFTPRVVLVFDGDEAGQAAARRGVFTLAPFDLEVSVLVLPPEEDPDSYVKNRGPGEFKTLVAGAQPAAEFIIGKAIAEHGSGTARGQKAVIEQLAPLEASMTNVLAKNAFKKTLAEQLGIDEKTVYRLMRGTGGQSFQSGTALEDEVYLRSLEGSFLHLLISSPELIAEARQYIAPETLTDKLAGDIYLVLLAVYDERGTLEGLCDRAGEGDARRLVSRMLVRPALEANCHDELVQKIVYLRRKFLKARIRENRVRLKSGPASPDTEALIRLIHEDLKQLKDLEEGE
ncbi:MAG: DNA primase [Chitinispirillaceae bacterium]|nr:DNA primase [Chitinispirillaceae bacterium]